MDGEGSFAPLDSSHRFEDIIFRAANALAAHCLENTGGEVGVSKGRVGGEDEFFSPRPAGDGRADDNANLPQRGQRPPPRRKVAKISLQ